MKLKQLAAFIMLLAAVGCTAENGDVSTAPAPDTSNVTSSEPDAMTVEPATQLASTVSFDVTGMT